jgi:glucuronoarabinoxylan endo-1,4-beta-xylanase
MRKPCLLFGISILLLSATAQAADVAIDRTAKYQTMDGFGFFGAMDTWWGTPSNMVNDSWVAQVLGDLGISIWRNEYYPPADKMASQDADWTKQKPVVQSLKRLSDANQIPLRVILTVWSPPSALKCEVDSANSYLPIEGTAPQSTKGGSTLCKSSWDDFAAWLIAGLQMYKDIGVDVFGLSFQNEPYFMESYNSCFYVQSYYAQTLAYVGPKIKAVFPKVKLFGPENMLEMEAGDSRSYFYVGVMESTSAAVAAEDVLAVHGYNDGVIPTATSKMSTLWSTMQSDFAQPLNKPLWMTETSGYIDTWTSSKGSDGNTYPGASDLAYSMYAALGYGHMSAWVWWQGSELGGFTTASLMAGTKSLSKRYYISKQFFRFIRPGASMVKATSADSEVLALAFEHVAMGSFTAILINSSSQQKSISLTGANVPTTLSLYTTSATDNCVNNGTVNAASITLAPNTVNTLVFGNVYESGSSMFVGVTSSGDAGGASGSGGAIGAGGQNSGSGGIRSSGGVTGSGGITSSGGIANSGGITSSGGIASSGGIRGSGGVKGASSDAGVSFDTGAGGDTSAGGKTGIIGAGGATSLALDAGVPVAGASGSIDGGAEDSTGFRGSADASSSANKSSGCSCYLGTSSNSSVVYRLGPIGLVLPIGFVLWRRRRRSSPV